MNDDKLIPENFLGNVPLVQAKDDNYLAFIKARKPVIIRGLSDNWPARKVWNFSYFRQKVNPNLKILVKDLKSAQQIPINFLEALSTIEAQVTKASDNEGICLQMGQIITGGHYLRSKPILKVLQDDFILPDFVPRKNIMEVNLWLNSGNVTTKLHYDPVDNLLSMLQGKKELIIFPPNQSKFLYQSKISSVHSQIDPRNPDYVKFPKFKYAKYLTTILEPGDTLYMPQGHWHQVTSLELNIALNIWWWPKWPHILELLKKPSRHFLWREFKSRVKGKGVFEKHANDQVNEEIN